MKARGRISDAGGHEAHLAALAYMSDSYFVGTIARVHKLWRYSAVRKGNTKSSIDEDVLKKLLAMDDEDLKRVKFVDQADLQRIRRLRNGEVVSEEEPPPEIGMMVSLDHSIYFHNPRDFRADEWMFTEMETPWTGDGRGLVFQKMFSRDGTLIASCVQEVSPLMCMEKNFSANCPRASFVCASLVTASCEVLARMFELIYVNLERVRLCSFLCILKSYFLFTSLDLFLLWVTCAFALIILQSGSFANLHFPNRHEYTATILSLGNTIVKTTFSFRIVLLALCSSCLVLVFLSVLDLDGNFFINCHLIDFMYK